MIGIISRDEISFVSHGLFQNYRFALKNYFGDLKNVNTVEDLEEITTLFIVDEHFIPHTEIWRLPGFIEKLNEKNIKTVIFNFEKIYDSAFPWNAAHQREVERITNLVQFVSDVNDAVKMGKKYINKQLLSRDTKLIEPIMLPEKNGKIAFIGQLSPDCYHRRRSLIRQLLDKGIEIDIINTDRKLTYDQYLHTLNKYSYILNPLGTGDFINIRFYEALKLLCIPLQQYTGQMLSYYDEFRKGISYNFQDSNHFGQFNDHRLKPYYTFNYYLEDYFAEINLKELIS